MVYFDQKNGYNGNVSLKREHSFDYVIGGVVKGSDHCLFVGGALQ